MKTIKNVGVWVRLPNMEMRFPLWEKVSWIY